MGDAELLVLLGKKSQNLIREPRNIPHFDLADFQVLGSFDGDHGAFPLRVCFVCV